MDITARKTYELPDYEGHPDGDILLEQLLEKHCTCSSACRHPHVQKPGERHVGNMMQIDDATYAKRRTEILKEMWRDYPDMGEEDILVSARNTYVEDASACFNRHSRPKMGCIDYRDDKKRIGSPTKNRMLAELAPVYLCDFCPVKTWVTTEIRHSRGMYK